MPNERIAWLAVGPGIVARHAWVITPTPSGCAILTEETQRGVVARLGKLIFPTACKPNIRSGLRD